MADLNDAKEQEQWLQKVPAPVKIALGTRVALRHLPHVLTMPDQEIWDFNSDNLVLACLRANLISGVSVSLRITGKENEIKAAALNSASAANLAAARRAPRKTITAAGVAIATVGKVARGSESSTHDQDLKRYDPPVHSNTLELLNASLNTDITLLDSAFHESSRVFEKPLWTGKMPEEIAIPWLQFLEKANGTPWEFWSEWYERMLNGAPIDWELQRQIALIHDDVWNAGPEAVAEEIEEIRARWQVERALTELIDSLSAQTAARHGIGGNNPPESIEDERLSGSITLVWEAAEELSTALEEENPAREWVEAILKKLKVGCLALTKWIGRKADLAVDTVIETAIKKGIPLAGGYYALDRLIKAIEEWLPFLS